MIRPAYAFPPGITEAMGSRIRKTSARSIHPHSMPPDCRPWRSEDLACDAGGRHATPKSPRRQRRRRRLEGQDRSPESPTMPRRLLLVGWDAADWQIIDPLMARGEMPHLAGLIANGARGNLATIYPPLSPMLWTTIATGKRPPEHGILGFTEPAEDGLFVHPISNLGRKTKALWNILNQNGKRSIVVGWWPSHPAEPIRGAMVSEHFKLFPGQDLSSPLQPGTIWPPA